MSLISTKERSCPSRASTWISNVICRGFYCCQWSWGERWVCWYWWNCWPSCLKLSLHSHISHRIAEYKKDHRLNILMFCKLQHGQIEGIWYLQISKAWQVVEYAWLDWCNLIRMQIPTKYKIRTKYNDNLRPNKHKESWKTTYRNTKIKRRRNK
jgi:hypothetical protein